MKPNSVNELYESVGYIRSRVDFLVEQSTEARKVDLAIEKRLNTVENRVGRIYWVASLFTLPFTILFKKLGSKHGS